MEDVDALLADLARWTADTRTDDAARSRIRERWLRQQAEEDARFAGVVLDLSEAGVSVGLRLTSGRAVHGRIVTVARDFCVLRHDRASATLLAYAAIATVRPEPGYRAGQAAASERAAPLDASLVDVLVGLAGERPRVRLVVEGGEGLAGELRSVGADVATLRLDGERGGGTVYVQLGAVREVTLLS